MASKKMGRPTDSPKTAQITVRFEPDQVKILDDYGQKHGITRVEAIRRAVLLLSENE